MDKKLTEEASMKEENERDRVMQSYPLRALNRRLKDDWARDAREGPRVLRSLRVDFGPMSWAKYEPTNLCTYYIKVSLFLALYLGLHIIGTVP